jgi:hypothetical protein
VRPLKQSHMPTAPYAVRVVTRAGRERRKEGQPKRPPQATHDSPAS